MFQGTHVGMAFGFIAVLAKSRFVGTTLACSMSRSASSSLGALPSTPVNVARSGAGGQESHQANECRPDVAIALPHTNRARLDMVGPSRYMAVDTVTQERKTLPEGMWDIVFDDKGRAAFVSADSSFKLADDIFGFGACRDDQGIVYLSFAASGERATMCGWTSTCAGIERATLACRWAQGLRR